MNEKIKKYISITLAFVMIANQIIAPASVFAEELPIDIGDSEVETIISPVPEDPETVNPEPEEETPAEEPPENEGTAESGNSTAVIETGDAEATAVTDIVINYDETASEGEISTDGCNPEGTITCDIIDNNNSDTEHSATAAAITGRNDIVGADDALIDTGAADALAVSKGLINTNVIEGDPKGDAPEDTSDNEDDGDNSNIYDEKYDHKPEEDNEDDKTGTIIILNNEGDHKSITKAGSVSGDNGITEAVEGTILTDASVASANHVLLMNTNIIGTSFEVFLFDILSASGEDINLNDLWDHLMESEVYGSTELTNEEKLAIFISNEANIDVEVVADALSGNNSIEADESGFISTGDSFASANAFNLANVNIIGSLFMLGVINIFGDFSGNIILPSPEKFASYHENLTDEEKKTLIKDLSRLAIDNNATLIESNIEATATSGENSETGQDLTTVTGDSLASSTSTSFMNLDLLLSNWYLAIFNNFGIWDGNILSWETPSTVAGQEDATAQYTNMNDDVPETTEIEGGTIESKEKPHPGSITHIDNEAKLTVQASAHARSGGNTTEADTSFIETGRSIALANMMNILNTNIIGSRIFMPIINLFGTWTGDLVFAYPDLTIDISSNKQDVEVGDTVMYTVNYENLGYEEAHNSQVRIIVPSAEGFISSAGPTPTVQGQTLIFDLGIIDGKDSGHFTFQTKVHSYGSEDEQASLLERIVDIVIPAAHADSDAIELTTQANIGSPSTESNDENNSSSILKYLMPDNEYSLEDQKIETSPSEDNNYGAALLFVSSYHNVGEYIHPGDTITFTANIINDGSGTASDVILYQDIFSPQGATVMTNDISIGSIAPGTQKKVTFSIRIPTFAPGGQYESAIYSDGTDEYDDVFVSNASISSFLVQGALGLIDEVYADEGQDNETDDANAKVLGESESQPCTVKRDYLPYILAAALAFLWFVETRRRRRLDKELKELLNEFKKNKK